MWAEYFRIAIRNIKTRPLRSWLTILGIVIGAFLIMSLLSLSEGLKNTVLQQLRAIGKDIVMIIPGDISDIFTTLMGAVELTKEDLKAIEKTKGVEAVIPWVYKGEVMKYQGESKTVILLGMPLQHADIIKNDLGMDTAEGRWPIAGKRELLVGSVVSEDVFPGLKINTQATIKGQKFEVVGILKSLGNSQDDSMISMDLNIFRQITGKKEGAPQAMAKIAPGYDPEKVVEDIKENLQKTRKRQRGEEEASFSVLTNEAMSAMVGSIMGIIQMAVFAFASIAIIVGGIGIMNTMYTSVRERTKEIGIMKAVGAKRSTITLIFLIESGVIGLVGGIGGMVLGLGLAKLVELVGQIYSVSYISASITPGIVIFGLTFSFLIGCLSGFFPARSAASLKPIDALRYE